MRETLRSIKNKVDSSYKLVPVQRVRSVISLCVCKSIAVTLDALGPSGSRVLCTQLARSAALPECTMKGVAKPEEEALGEKRHSSASALQVSSSDGCLPRHLELGLGRGPGLQRFQLPRRRNFLQQGTKLPARSGLGQTFLQEP